MLACQGGPFDDYNSSLEKGLGDWTIKQDRIKCTDDISLYVSVAVPFISEEDGVQTVRWSLFLICLTLCDCFLLVEFRPDQFDILIWIDLYMNCSFLK